MLNNIIFKAHVPYGTGIGNSLKGFISGLTINENTKIECNPNYMLGNFETILDKKYILNKEDINNCIIEPFSSCRWLILKSEENIQKDFPYEYSDYNNVDLNNNKYKHMFTSKVTIDHNYDRALINDIVFNRFINVINNIKFTETIYSEIKNYEIDYENSLGISVRTWKGKHEHNINRKYNFDEYKSAILNILDSNKHINTIVFSIDNENEEDKYLKLFNNFENIKIINYKNINVNHLQHAMIKILLLSKCKFFICNRISTFSELVFWFGNCKQKVTPLF